jgi:negative regulator of sigma E activity
MTAETHPVEREQLMAYLDGELAANEAARVAAHLQECAECQRLEADLRSVSAQMLSWNVEPAPQQLNDGVLAALHADASQHTAKEPWNLFRFLFQRRIRIARWGLAAACVGVAAMILLKVFNPPLSSVQPADKLASSAQLKSMEGQSESLTGGGAASREEAKLARRRSMPAPVMSPAPLPAAPAPLMESRAMQMNQMAKKRADDFASMNDNLAQPPAPMIARTASLKISAKDFPSARAGVDRIIASFHGFAASMTINNAVGEPQSLNAELHFPAAECNAALAALKALGRVEQEQQGGEEVTAQVVDLDARLKNARETETRLQDILKTRTGKVSDVLEVENQIAEARQNIEQMEGEQKTLRNRITFSAITLELHEEYQASLETNAPSAGRRIRNAIVDGFRSAAESSIGLLVFLLNAVPSLLLATIILFWPIRWALRRLRTERNTAAAPAH